MVGQYAVVTNHASPCVPIKLSVVSLSDLANTHHHLDVPEGAYDRTDRLYACGHEKSGVAVTAWNKPFVDLYDPAGELYTIHMYIVWYDVNWLQWGIVYICAGMVLVWWHQNNGNKGNNGNGNGNNGVAEVIKVINLQTSWWVTHYHSHSLTHTHSYSQHIQIICWFL